MSFAFSEKWKITERLGKSWTAWNAARWRIQPAMRWMARGPHEIESEEYSARNSREIRREIRRALRIFLPPTDFDFPVRHGLRRSIDLPPYSPWTRNSSRFLSFFFLFLHRNRRGPRSQPWRETLRSHDFPIDFVTTKSYLPCSAILLRYFLQREKIDVKIIRDVSLSFVRIFFALCRSLFKVLPGFLCQIFQYIIIYISLNRPFDTIYPCRRRSILERSIWRKCTVLIARVLFPCLSILSYLVSLVLLLSFE